MRSSKAEDTMHAQISLYDALCAWFIARAPRPDGLPCPKVGQGEPPVRRG